ncbi:MULTISPECIES: MGH1-like glycoside hydrolase domain-containing protein [unclassified Lentimonas]|uniref:MGH1-like glycoside hydrolase domain-containing protein n=1 Tax=unclassified Lentimonas TaxID=2630993 RepID=UPI001325D6DC|nr:MULTISPECIES: glucosidase [unclassified Lentimonas]CAA6677306.1 Acyl-coenzyme A synthetases/AMP-(fatty) acid ligases [Lentimonas sp. CC4]CAA6686851.1 Acyl-coenzyme A synthetases/AMP-(fatty) acid ligases [Lentimonas sp. CC6]CAA7074552.1 Acyl-coenzyme A synthetases/AMP-(fatty) acid ligases [Lentimonas sp. CC4]CAA7169168.1 Acyl-coenzyme A synthetases/AMP-(fatty) acid ligases [Lentimonas sp. CC21]CAA7180431.1 Acyl-coenzyme A synthetases/AMP-(fatty) acid ligases [Lentimonas sp. CC8]
MQNEEQKRLTESTNKQVAWKKWGPYLSERQWGTVREDYSAEGNAWDYFPHDQARSRAYRRGEDGLAGISDDQQQLCFALALWNENDSILKERLFGLTNEQGNHGEDVKEYYFYLDSTPTHSYMKYLYKYPQAAYPYKQLLEKGQQRSRLEPEYELLDTGIFDEDRYFDVTVEYAKAGDEDLLIKISAVNRGPESAKLRLLPTLWFRKTWHKAQTPQPRPYLCGSEFVTAHHPKLGEFHLFCEHADELLYTENETNHALLFNGTNKTPYVKDGINDTIVSGSATTNPEHFGTKVAAHYRKEIAPGATETIRLRLSKGQVIQQDNAFNEDFEATFAARIQEADAFYDNMIPDSTPAAERQITRQAIAGMMWTKQYYEYNVQRWIDERSHLGLPPRNSDWGHMVNCDIISMPDKWEYPWYATWDLGFHTIALVLADPAFAKEQLMLFMSDRYMHPNGQLPAYEWNFSDVNPPVHPFAVLTVYMIDKQQHGGAGDTEFLEAAFKELERNFQWWVDHKDPSGKGLFDGGFLGLDNIGVFDRSSALPTGGKLEQSDSTFWMVLYSQYMLRMAIELTNSSEHYEAQVLKYYDHFLRIASGMDRVGTFDDEMWDSVDGFFYDVLRYPDGHGTRLKVRSLVGLLPMCANSVIDSDILAHLPQLQQHCREVYERHAATAQNVACPQTEGINGRHLLAITDETKLRQILSRMLDENEFLSPYGIRSLSKHHQEHPYTFDWDGQTHSVSYLPGESDSGMFGGNSNWRGPIWMPTNFLIIRALSNFYAYYGDDFKIECPTGSGNRMTLYEVSSELCHRLTNIFLRNDEGKRPVYGESDKFQNDPHWRDHILFYEYFHADNGTGIGASHQTGWTGMIATIITLMQTIDADLISSQGTGGIADQMAKVSTGTVNK